jgi:Cu/Ag efflux protein CusF
MRVWKGALATALAVLMIGGLVGSAFSASHTAAPAKTPETKPAPAGKAPAAGAEKTSRHAGTVKAVDAAGRMLTVAEKSGEVMVTVPEKASIKRGKDTVKLEDLKAGDAVTVVYVQQDGKDVARSIAVKAQ